MAGHRLAPPHDHARALAQRVRALREDRGWTRERLAKEAGIAVGTLGRLESEGAIQPGFLTVGAVAEALAVSLDDLFRATQVAPVTPGLWSAGYEGRDIDSFVAALVDSRIGVVADVRLTPISRKKGFSKTRLGEALAEAGIEYTHLRGLGNPKDNREPFWDGRVEVGRARFRGLLRSEEARADLDTLEIVGSVPPDGNGKKRYQYVEPLVAPSLCAVKRDQNNEGPPSASSSPPRSLSGSPV